MAQRPDLTSEISGDDFCSFYWLKEELVAFCQKQNLPVSGSKQALAERIKLYLETGTIEAVQKKSNNRSGGHSHWPENLSRQTVIPTGAGCSQDLRAFFMKELGPSFHFNGIMRDFIKNGQGKTLGDAITAWQEGQKNPVETQIGSQFEYNRFVREYFKQHPGGNLKDAILAWNQKKAQRRSQVSDPSLSHL